MSVEPARIWHLPRLLGILWQATRGMGPVARARHEDVCALGGLIWRRKVLVWRAGGRLRGFLARDGVRLHALYVCPGWRGQGAGAALLASAQSESARLELFTATDNRGAQRFYGRHGFQVLRSGVGQGNDEGIADLFMAWERPQL